MKFKLLYFIGGILFSMSSSAMNVTIDVNNCEADTYINNCHSDEMFSVNDNIPAMNFMELLKFVRDYQFLNESESFELKKMLYERYWNNRQVISSPFDIKKKENEINSIWENVKHSALEMLNDINSITLKNTGIFHYNFLSLYNLDKEIIDTSSEGVTIELPHQYNVNDSYNLEENLKGFSEGLQFSMSIINDGRFILDLPLNIAEELYKLGKPIDVKFEHVKFNVLGFQLVHVGGLLPSVQFKSEIEEIGNSIYRLQGDDKVLYIGSPPKIMN